jgi:hypothetical protein
VPTARASAKTIPLGRMSLRRKPGLNTLVVTAHHCRRFGSGMGACLRQVCES